MLALRSFVLAIGVWAAGTAVAADNVYFGNLHSHTSYSDGSGSPADAFARARNVAHLDFLAITEHNHAAAELGAKERADGLLIATNHALYDGPQATSLIEAARAANSDGRFVAIYGQEFSTISSGNHANVFDAPSVIDVPNGDFRKLVGWLKAHPDSTGHPPLVQFNHPAEYDGWREYGRDDFPDSTNALTDASWIAGISPYVSLIELLNGPAMRQTDGGMPAHVQEADYLHFLALGFHLAPSSGQDNHYKTWGTVTDARVAIISDTLSKAEVLGALRARHAYATEDRNLRIVLRINGHLLGDIAPAPPKDSLLDIRVSLRDDDEPDAAYRVDVFSGAPGGADPTSPVKSITLQGDTATPYAISGVRFADEGQFVLIRVTQIQAGKKPDRAWTAPVWFESSQPNSPGLH